MFWKKEGKMYVKAWKVETTDDYLPVMDPNDSEKLYEQLLTTIEQMDVGEGKVPAWEKVADGEYKKVMVDASVFWENSSVETRYLWYLDPNEDLETYLYVVESIIG